ncbi:TniQ protein [Neptunomonas qingdaonensis]|uniref:TniQ protein n=1 Tax=Neptunomonas qingdaonensis TaxID=1045558 RepID=A0A1I2MJF3_9GAMM|nr:TniQ protein [Neptunomonas qingdaonensis]
MPEESLQSYLFRLARANGYGYYALTILISNAAPLRSFKLDDRIKIKELLLEYTDHGAVLSLFDPWAWADTYRGLFDFSRIKLCPKCYHETNVLHASWSFRYHLLCAEHRGYLIDRCSQCNCKFTNESLLSGKCEGCGKKIGEMNFESVDGLLFHELIYQGGRSSSTQEEYLVQLALYTKTLEPYLWLLGDNVAKYWNSRRHSEIPKLAGILNDVILLHMERSRVSDAIVDYLKINTERESISAATIKLNRFLTSGEFEDFTIVFKEELLRRCDELAGIKVPLTWIKKVYGLTEEDLVGANVHRRQRGLAIDCKDLEQVVSRNLAACG